jgi:hypothetical protein
LNLYFFFIPSLSFCLRISWRNPRANVVEEYIKKKHTYKHNNRQEAIQWLQKKTPAAEKAQKHKLRCE